MSCIPHKDSDLYEEYCRKNHIYYTRYTDYVSPDGTIYPKNNAEFVPNEELVSYIKWMGYVKFETDHVSIELDRKKLRATMHKYEIITGEHKWYTCKELTKTIYLRGPDAIYAKIYSLMTKGILITIFTPSYIYTSSFLVGPECGYDTDDLEEEKYTRNGAISVKYINNKFTKIKEV